MNQFLEEGQMLTHRSPTGVEIAALCIALLAVIATVIVSIGGIRTVYFFLRGDAHNPETLSDCDEYPDYSEDARLYDAARAALDDGRPGDALKLLERSWSLYEHAATAHQVAIALKQLNRANESHPWHARAHELNPKQSQYAVAYAESLHTQGRTGEAIKLLKRTLKHNRDYGPAKRLLETITA